jgi:hypothetical protein
MRQGRPTPLSCGLTSRSPWGNGLARLSPAPPCGRTYHARMASDGAQPHAGAGSPRRTAAADVYPGGVRIAWSGMWLARSPLPGGSVTQGRAVWRHACVVSVALSPRAPPRAVDATDGPTVETHPRISRMGGFTCTAAQTALVASVIGRPTGIPSLSAISSSAPPTSWP